MNTDVIKISPDDIDFDKKIKIAADKIMSGGLVVFPTETVYGLGADATNPIASKKIYEAKGRPSDNPLIIHIDTPEMADKYAYTNETYYKLASKFMPGPLTVVLPAKNSVPKETRGGLETVAVRCPENVIARNLISACGIPIAAPSANISGTPSPTTADHVVDDMYGRVDIILDGGCADFGLESTIIKIDSDDSVTLLRPGKITVDDLKSVVKNVIVADAVIAALSKNEVAISPGMKYRHYAPKADFELLDADLGNTVKYIKSKGTSNVAVLAYEEDILFLKKELPNVFFYSFGSRESEQSQAKMLFCILRDADKRSFDKIYAPLPQRKGVGLALYNRMIRAASHKIVKL